MESINKAGLIKPLNLRYPGVFAAFTTRSVNIYSATLSEMFTVPENRIFIPAQKHTSTVHVLSTDSRPVIADAVVTVEKMMLIGVQVADCVPILVHERKRHVIAAVHAGWRGTAEMILPKTLKRMRECFGSSPDDMYVALGPSIRSCCYIVDRDVQDAVCSTVEGDSCWKEEKGKYFLDLSTINIHQACSMGVREENIWQSGECTLCNHGRFHSYRRDGKSEGRQGGFIMLW